MRPAKRAKTTHQELKVSIKHEAPPSPQHASTHRLYEPLFGDPETDDQSTTVKDQPRDLQLMTPDSSASSSSPLVKPTKLESPEVAAHDYSWLESPKRTYTQDPGFPLDYLSGWIWEHGAPVTKPNVKYKQGLFWLCRHCFHAPSPVSSFDDPTCIDALFAGIENSINNTEYNWSYDSGFGGALVEFHLLTKHGIRAPEDAAIPGLFEMFNLNPTNGSHCGLVERLEEFGDDLAAITKGFKSGVTRWKKEQEAWLEGRPSLNIHRELCKKARYKIFYR